MEYTINFHIKEIKRQIKRNENSDWEMDVMNCNENKSLLYYLELAKQRIETCNDESLQPKIQKCAMCGKKFIPRSSKARFCSTTCRVRKHRTNK